MHGSVSSLCTRTMDILQHIYGLLSEYKSLVPNLIRNSNASFHFSYLYKLICFYFLVCVCACVYMCVCVCVLRSFLAGTIW